MGKFILKFVRFILSLQEKRFAHKKEKILMNAMNSVKSCSGLSHSTSKIYVNSTETLKLTSQTEKNKSRLDLAVKEIVKKNIKTPHKLLEYIKKSGTPVYKIKNADTILNSIGEEEGFITPHKGFKAFYLNLILNGEISFKTKPMFVLRDLPLNIYSMAHQFHKWYGYKMGLPGFDEDTQLKFKKIWKYANKSEAERLSLNEILSLKEAIERDVEAIDFVINLSKSNDGAKNSLKKIVNGQGAKL